MLAGHFTDLSRNQKRENVLPAQFKVHAQAIAA
jgi:hypothetical protein